MFKKIILVFMCLIILVSCGRKNDPKYEISSNGEVMNFNDSINILDTPKKDEI
tara:strand:- start:574 stop:732 length:159 start_codon:yes stop_codon:yes gene_type:complete